MVLNDGEKVRTYQENIINLLNEYEKLRSASKNENFCKNTKSTNETNLSQYQKKHKLLLNTKLENRLNDMLSFLNHELTIKINETALEIIFFKQFIGTLNINKIIVELFTKEINV